MNNKDVSVLLKKADELRALFVLGQRVIPFLEEIFLFVSEIQPLLDDINHSIQENLSKMPNASKQLSKVTEATELATSEIMDIVDGLVYKSDIITSNTNKLNEIVSKKMANHLKLLEIIYKGIDSGSNMKEVMPHLAKTINSLKQSKNQSVMKIVDETNELTQSISMDSSSIMMSLQVQDITSQQIAAVNNLLETIQGKLGRILKNFQDSNIQDLIDAEEGPVDNTNVSKMHRAIAFDPEAVLAIEHKENEKSMASGEENKQAEPEPPADNSPASQDDIDALFSNMEDDSSPASNDDIDALFNSPAADDTDDADTSASQDDIDALFGDSDGPASQDDIDALFG
jgi:chemotaxis regulatin CheY-phosphate phosphatase CheZ